MKRIARLAGFISFCLIFIFFAILAWPVLLFTSQRTRGCLFARTTQIWARLLLRIIGIRVVPHRSDNDCSGSHYLFVCNHQSYLDIVVIASVFPTLFVAKKEVAQWPVLGWLARLGETIFVDRENAHSGVKCAYRASRLLRDGVSIQVFPEGTTGDGSEVLPFRGLFFASAIRAQAQILPLTINFQAVNGETFDDRTRDVLCWYGEMDFLRHFWNLLKIDSAEVSLMIHEPIKPSRIQRAKIIAQAAQQKVITGFDSAKASAIAVARAEVPVEFAAAREPQQSVEAPPNENEQAMDFIIGALLFSLFASNQSDAVSELIPHSEN